MSGLLKSYLEEFDGRMAKLNSEMAALRESIAAQEAHASNPTAVYHPPPATGALSRGQQMQAIHEDAAHAKDLLISMGYELHDVAGEERETAKAQVDSCRARAAPLDAEIPKLRQLCNQADRADLLGYGRGVSPGTGRREGDLLISEADEETKVNRLLALQTTERLQSGTTTLQKAEAYLAQANATGHEVVGALKKQTEQIGQVQGSVLDVDGELSYARQVMSDMQRTALKQKLQLIGIVLVLVAFIVLLFYLHGR